MNLMAHDRSDDELAKGIANLDECDRLIRKLKWQRRWFPLFGVMGFVVLGLGAAAIVTKQLRPEGAFPTGLLTYMTSVMTFLAATILIGLNQLDIRPIFDSIEHRDVDGERVA